MTTETAATRWLVLTGALLYPPRLAVIVGDAKPVSTSTVVVKDAWLSFDVSGVPFVEPCYANVLLKGFNDEEGLALAEKDGEAYRRWLWERCCPGKRDQGTFPPQLEGVAYELDAADHAAVVQRACAFLPTVPTVLAPVTATRYEKGDPEQPTGDIEGEVLVMQPKDRRPGLQPTAEYHTLVLRGAFLNALSRPFLIHLISLRPFDRSSRLKALARTFYRLCLIPSFLLFYLPARIFAAPAWAEMGGYLLGQGVVKLKALERLARGFVGSGWRNDLVKP